MAKEMINPVDHHLLQQGHLDTWRALRTIDRVVRHNRSPSIYWERTLKLGPKLMKISPSKSQTEKMHRNALAWAKSKPHRQLATVTYYLIEILKSYSPRDTHEEIERIAEGISDPSKFNYLYNSGYARNRVSKFLDEKMSKIGLHLLMERLGNDFDVDRTVIPNSLINSQTYQWKKEIPQADQDVYAKHYKRYMKMIEILDKLATAGIENRAVIRTVNTKTPRLVARNIFKKSSFQPRTTHRYLINKSPFDRFKPLQMPIFGYPDEIDGKSSASIQATVNELWKTSGQDDISLATRLFIKPSSIPEDIVFCPERLRHTRGYRAINAKEKYPTTDPRYTAMWNRVERTVRYTMDIDEQNPEERLIFWRMLGSAFLAAAKDPDFTPNKFVRQVENTVMFYMLLRRIGKALEEAVEINLPTPPPEGRVTRSQYMMYYWTLVSYKTTGELNKREITMQVMQFELGRVYINHLLASQKLKDLYDRIRSSRTESPEELTVLDRAEEEMLPRYSTVKEVERRLSGRQRNPQAVRSSLRGSANDKLETLQHASESSPSARKTTPYSIQNINSDFQTVRRSPRRGTNDKLKTLQQPSKSSSSFQRTTSYSNQNTNRDLQSVRRLSRTGAKDKLKTLQQASESSSSVRKTTSYPNEYIDMLNFNIPRDMLNFNIPRKKSSRYPHSMTPVNGDTISHIVLQPSAQKRQSILDHVVGSDRDIPVSLNKKPRTESAVISSSENRGSHILTQDAGPTTPSIDGIQNTPQHQHSTYEEPNQESMTDGETRLSSQLLVENIGVEADQIKSFYFNPELPSSIPRGSGEIYKPSSHHTQSLDLNEPPEDSSGDNDVVMMLPDLNEPLEPALSHMQNNAPNMPTYFHPSLFQQLASDVPDVPAHHTFSPQVSSREEIPDLNL